MCSGHIGLRVQIGFTPSVSAVVGDAARGAASPGTGATASAGRVRVKPDSRAVEAGLALPLAGVAEGGLGHVDAAPLRQPVLVEAQAGERLPVAARRPESHVDRWAAHVLDAVGRPSLRAPARSAAAPATRRGRRRSGIAYVFDRRVGRERGRAARAPREHHTAGGRQTCTASSARRESAAPKNGSRGIAPILPRRDRNWASGGVHLQRRSRRRGSRARRVVAVGPARASRDRLGRRTAARRRASAGAARCSSTANRGSRASRRSRGSPVGRSPRSKDSIRDARRAGRRRSCATGGSQCGFCTPGILVRAASLAGEGPGDTRPTLDRALAAHLCRCTGWQTIYEALDVAAAPDVDGQGAATTRRRDADAAARRAELEGGVAPVGGSRRPARAGRVRRRHRAARRAGRGPAAAGLERAVDRSGGASAGWSRSRWSRHASSRARCRAGGRRSTTGPPLALPPLPPGGVRLATGGSSPRTSNPTPPGARRAATPASPLANGGAFGGKESSVVAAAARELADATGRTVRAVFSREDVVRLGPKRPPIAASAVVDGDRIDLRGVVARDLAGYADPPALAYALRLLGDLGGRRRRRSTDRDPSPLRAGRLPRAGRGRDRRGRARSTVTRARRTRGGDAARHVRAARRAAPWRVHGSSSTRAA